MPGQLSTRNAIDRSDLGGVYQYSTDRRLETSALRKVMQMQAESLRTYAQSYAFWNESILPGRREKNSPILGKFSEKPGRIVLSSQDADLARANIRGYFRSFGYRQASPRNSANRSAYYAP